MTTTLFICEKPDMARNIAAALSQQTTEKKGYIEGDNGHIYTYAIGHLLSLAPPEFYNPELKKWAIETLPIIPEQFKLLPIPGKEGQLKIIDSLIKKADIVVNSCDSAREGEVIANYIFIHLGMKNKPIKRLWTSSLTEDAIRRSYQSMKDGEEYKGLFFSGYARAQADWLIGMNASRIYTLKSNGEKFTIGRVQTPTLAMIYDRCEEHFNFSKIKYFPVKVLFRQNDEEYVSYWEGEKIKDKVQAEKIAAKVKNKPGVVKDFEKKSEKKYAPPLFSLSLLTKEANKKYPLGAKEILAIAQSLYEKHKCITYPRTSSSYVTKDDIPVMHQSLKALENSPFENEAKGADPTLVHTGNKRVCNEKGVTDHHAILPTHKIPNNLSQNEQLIYNMIVKRFLSQFYPPALYDKYAILTEVEGEIFKTTVSHLLSAGWKALFLEEKEEQNIDETILKPIQITKEEPVLCIDSEVLEKETSPPPLFTDGTLVDSMKKAGKKVENDELKEVLNAFEGVGTEATRADIIKKLIDTEYISYKGKSLLITVKGKFIIETIRETDIKSLTSVEYTAEWEKRLNLIANNQYSPQEFMLNVKKFTKAIINEASKMESLYRKEIQVLGDCPVCGGGKIVSGKKSYGCSNWKEEGCEFKIWKKSFNKTISEKQALLLLTKRETGVLSFTSKEKGTKFSAKLILDENNQVKLKFANESKGK